MYICVDDKKRIHEKKRFFHRNTEIPDMGQGYRRTRTIVDKVKVQKEL